MTAWLNADVAWVSVVIVHPWLERSFSCLAAWKSQVSKKAPSRVQHNEKSVAERTNLLSGDDVQYGSEDEVAAVEETGPGKKRRRRVSRSSGGVTDRRGGMG